MKCRWDHTETASLGISFVSDVSFPVIPYCAAIRLLRKKGVGVILISQKISDFDPAMRSAMNISILFRTKYEGDLKAIARMLGSESSEKD